MSLKIESPLFGFIKLKKTQVLPWELCFTLTYFPLCASTYETKIRC